MSIQAAIQKLANKRTLPSQDEAYAVMQQIMCGDATSAQIAAYLMGLRFVGENAKVIAGSAQAMREACTRVTTERSMVVDTCGTGGDGAKTFNISTTAAFVAAGAGVPIAKHGNRSISSQSGSADVLAALGVDISLEADAMSYCLNDLGIAFLFAPALHPAMKHAIGPRREMGIRTLFNVLGPLTNPAGALRGIMGVYDVALVPRLAKALSTLGAKQYFVVHGHDGLDEITTTTLTTIGVVDGENISVYELDPESLGIPRASAKDLKGGTPEQNAEITESILNGETGPRRDVVLLNAAAAIVAGEKAVTLEDGLTRARESIDSGAAAGKLSELAVRTASLGSSEG